jgi:hypothetical protein
MTLFQAAAHAFTTMPTGGFSTQARSVEAFAAASQWVIIVFMALAGANFALMFRALVRRSPRVLWRDEELRLYLVLLTLGTVFILVALLRAHLFDGGVAIRHAAFQAVTTMTTTGYASTDSNLWPLAAQVVMIGLMFAGGCAGSTGGAIKPVRHLIVARILRREVDRTIRPDVVTSIRRNGVPIRDDTGRAVLTFVLLYVGVFALGTLLLAMDVVHTRMHVNLLDLVASAATTPSNRCARSSATRMRTVPSVSSTRYSRSSSSRHSTRVLRRTSARNISAKFAPARIMKTMITHCEAAENTSIERAWVEKPPVGIVVKVCAAAWKSVIRGSTPVSPNTVRIRICSTVRAT